MHCKILNALTIIIVVTIIIVIIIIIIIDTQPFQIVHKVNSVL